ncbi:hypothetical protein ASPWEDRAFT_41648 [Aspergillus wentii DTO 134E9]|uniref:F-box domain-containing protein n=1 Tax=Aspergillus wentii DTO 134E9 TaxID=1073089 RepID=A0A1L9RFT1_ASPWE|nr:uncharacterized protein ASPWEDRAFT_41648 [Aspergillus wentii DTO 134E9]KAI9925539.1 hypothetical protein MW887_005920 [Aspergillus wentii]OJJ33782.1 hypothetical protein ASPWEDRAFT_41648 [Aspergillus wentii DTO 134E9]
MRLSIFILIFKILTKFRKKKCRSLLLNSPVEIIYEITSWLPPASKLCLALTCKSLLAAIDDSKALRQSPDFQLIQSSPDPFAMDKNEDYCSQRFWLLHYLERDTRYTGLSWRLCHDCLKLHPLHEFSSKERCGLGVLTRGYIKVCPCWRLTIREVQRIFETLHQDKTQTLLLHDCSHKWWSSQINLKVTGCLSNDSPKRLILETNFDLYCTSFPKSFMESTQPVCSENFLAHYLRGYFSSDTRPSAIRDPKSKTCRLCRTSVTCLQHDKIINSYSGKDTIHHSRYRSQRVLPDLLVPANRQSSRALFEYAFHFANSLYSELNSANEKRRCLWSRSYLNTLCGSNPRYGVR